MDLFEKRIEIIKNLKSYFVRNMSAIKQEYKISIPESIVSMSNANFVAWVQVRASKILMAKSIENCAELKEMVIDFIVTEREIEVAENQIVVSQQCM